MFNCLWSLSSAVNWYRDLRSTAWWCMQRHRVFFQWKRKGAFRNHIRVIQAKQSELPTKDLNSEVVVKWCCFYLRASLWLICEQEYRWYNIWSEYEVNDLWNYWNGLQVFFNFLSYIFQLVKRMRSRYNHVSISDGWLATDCSAMMNITKNESDLSQPSGKLFHIMILS